MIYGSFYHFCPFRDPYMNIYIYIGPLDPKIPNTYQLNKDYYFYSFRGSYHSCNALNMVMIVW